MSGKTNKNALTKRALNRRTVLKGAAAAVGAAAIGLPAPAVHAARSIKIGVYGGYFKDSFDEFIFPEFAAASGIEVESVAEPTGETWLVQIRNAAKAGVAPADVSMVGGIHAAARRRRTALDAARRGEGAQQPASISSEPFVHRYDDGRLLRRRRGLLVHHLLHQHRHLSRAADLLGRHVGSAASTTDSLGLLALSTNSYSAGDHGRRPTSTRHALILQTKEGLDRRSSPSSPRSSPTCGSGTRTRAPSSKPCRTAKMPMAGQYYHDVSQPGPRPTASRCARPSPRKAAWSIPERLGRVSKASEKKEEARGLHGLHFVSRTSRRKLSRKVGTAPVMAARTSWT